jgi:signal transduction histidine kinase
MSSPLRILYLEDDPTDAVLVQDTLQASGIFCEITRVETRVEFLAALEQGGFALILADYSLPSFDGMSALGIAREKCANVPFIFVSGQLGEEVAIDALKIGATDYVLKTRLSRLVPSVQRAIRESRERAELLRVEHALRRSETYLAEAQRISHMGSFGWQLPSGEINWSRETFRIFEVDPQVRVTVDLIMDRVHPDDRVSVREVIERSSRDRQPFDFEHRLLLADGTIKHVRIVGHPSTSDAGTFEFVGAVCDITDRKNAEQVRLEERTRIARELHDTLLQGVQGLMIFFQAAESCLPGRPLHAKQLLVRALERGEGAIAEGRDAVRDLHITTVQDLAEGLTAYGEELVVEEGIAGVTMPSVFKVRTLGTPRALPLTIRSEVYRIGLEAVRNAFRHSAAAKIDVDIIYGDPTFEIRVRDDGRGIDPEIQTVGRRPGHWGISSMRERAVRIGATLVITSHPGTGTEVALSLPWAPN